MFFLSGAVENFQGVRVKNSKGRSRNFRRKITLKNIFSWGAPAHPCLGWVRSWFKTKTYRKFGVRF
ncbi:hypothetical protein HanPSC8_Chr16g0729761 [Helianthus annuus]|nr:hypothetical protein HanPSC8_Chr16g0729761 [Helianthus annuus]